MSVHEPVIEAVEVDEDFGADLSDDELGELVVARSPSTDVRGLLTGRA